MSVMFLKEFL